MACLRPARRIVWSTGQIDLSDPFQRRWYLRQVLMHGRTEDIRQLDLAEVGRELSSLHLPDHLARLWKRFLDQRIVG